MAPYGACWARLNRGGNLTLCNDPLVIRFWRFGMDTDYGYVRTMDGTAHIYAARHGYPEMIRELHVCKMVIHTVHNGFYEA